jgi:hypothetical protein
MGWAQSEIAPTPQQLRLRPTGGHAREEPGTVATAARRMLQLPKAEVVLAASLAQNGWLFISVVHAAFGGGGPRWQPLNGADRHALLARCQSESVLAGGNGDGGFQLRPDGYGARPSAGEGRRWQQRSGPVSTATDAKFVYCVLLIRPLFILVISIRLPIRPFLTLISFELVIVGQ